MIAAGLKEVCLVATFPELPVPSDIGDTLKLRLTAHTMGMDQYVQHFDDSYAIHVTGRVLSLREIRQVVACTRKPDDAILGVLANRLGYLCRFQKVSEKEQIEYAELLADDKYEYLLVAVDDANVKGIENSASD
jgi:hypothetical protein